MVPELTGFICNPGIVVWAYIYISGFTELDFYEETFLEVQVDDSFLVEGFSVRLMSFGNPAPVEIYKKAIVNTGDICHINWCRIFSINSSLSFPHAAEYHFACSLTFIVINTNG